MVGRNVILVNGLLDETHSENVGVEGMVASGVRCNRCEMMDAMQVHEATLHHLHQIADARVG